MNGVIDEHTLVWGQGLDSWLPVRNVRTLVPMIRTVEGRGGRQFAQVQFKGLQPAATARGAYNCLHAMPIEGCFKLVGRLPTACPMTRSANCNMDQAHLRSETCAGKNTKAAWARAET